MPESAHGIVLFCDKRGTILSHLHNSVHRAAAAQGNLAQLVSPSQRNRVFDFLSLLNASDDMIETELSLVDDDLAFTACGVRMTDGTLLVVLRRRGTGGDENLNEIMRLNNDLVGMQRELAQANARLQRLDREKNSLLSMVAHDLRSPLSGITGLAEMMLDRRSKFSDEELDSYLETIRNTSTYLNTIVDRTLDLSALESGALSIQRYLCDPEEVLRVSYEFYRTIAAKKDIAFEIEIESGLPKIYLDRDRMLQVLSNLASNALKFSPSGTRIRFSLRTRSMTASERSVVFSVADQGPGIPEQEQALLFQPFKRTSVRPTANEPGVGLGLALADRIVRAHDGAIEVASAPGRGSVFSVVIPIH